MDRFQKYKYLDIITVAFVVILLLSNLVASVKVSQIELLGHSLSFSSGLFFFPVSYLIGNILTEVYGYSRSRRVIWIGFISLFVANFITQILVALPPDPAWRLQEAYESIFGISLRVSFSSMLAYFCGEFINSFVIAKLKVLFDGKSMSLRIIGSTIAGEFVDTMIFYPLAFLGNPNFPPSLIIKIMITNYIVKVLWEIFAYPITKQIIGFLKSSESEDYYDRGTNFSPFEFKS
jgi:queuosine precursor transporter